MSKPMERVNKAGGYHLLEINQTEMAEWFQVDRTTITQYQRNGMPYMGGSMQRQEACPGFRR